MLQISSGCYLFKQVFSDKPSIISVVVKGLSCPLEWGCLPAAIPTKILRGFENPYFPVLLRKRVRVLQCICKLQIKYSLLPSSEFHQNHEHLSILPVYLSLKCSSGWLFEPFSLQISVVPLQKRELQKELILTALHEIVHTCKAKTKSERVSEYATFLKKQILKSWNYVPVIVTPMQNSFPDRIPEKDSRT